uniref:Protein kinase domain-containing protein n=1 Tax=Kalanchoe fedtschenkoi TaxID=63787 RepID=A0A7N0USB0_KALFE
MCLVIEQKRRKQRTCICSHYHYHYHHVSSALSSSLIRFKTEHQSFNHSTMTTRRLHLILLLLVTALTLSLADPNAFFQLNDDVLGLIVFKSDVHDPENHLAYWNEDDNSPCSWSYVKCNPAGRVTELSLDGLNLSGKIGRGLQKLQALKVLSLSHNKFAGVLSADMAPASSLETLNLSKNGFSGRVPASFVDMNTLKFLDLSRNSLTGEVPDALFSRCEALRQINLSGNELEGSLPNSIFHCTSLNSLNLANNHFSNAIDFSNGVWRLQRLRTLDLSNNMFSGLVPKGMSALHNLKELKLKGNHFSGLIPQDIGNCIHLQTLDLSKNQFTGEIPGSVQGLSSLSYFDLSSNLMAGEFPQWLSKLVSIQHLDFSSNQLSGALPETMAALGSLEVLNLADNQLSGNIPVSLGYCYRLAVVNLRNNHFNESIPPGLFDLGLEEIDISRNQLVGSIPKGSSRVFESLKAMDLSSNKLSGNIPAELGLFSNLGLLNLSWNALQSTIPPEIGYFQNLTILDLRSCGLGGTIPGDLCDSRSLNILRLDGNSLTGSVPDEIGNCSSLYLLSLSHNKLNGPIPRTLSLLSKLEILKLENNELSGEIPMELGSLTNLLVVNISYNRLIGRLPVSNVFQTLDQSSLQGNLGICSPLLKGACKMNVPKPLVLDPNVYGDQVGSHRHRPESAGATSFGNRNFLSISAIVAISAAVLILMGVLVITLLNVSAKKRMAFVDAALESMCSSSTRSGGPPTGRLVLFDSKPSSQGYITNPECLLNKAAELGTGVFGTVYKVPMGVEARILAIKKLVTSNMLQYAEDFDREVRVLAKAKHPNLVPLKGYYWTPQLQLLVMDHVPNGSLQDKLHNRIPSSPPMPWAIRFRILLGTAKGLAHLHHSFRPPIIHYSLKPSNILLDESYNPVLSDYGLARLLTKLDKQVTANRFQSALGYVAPELACQNLRVTEKCDVFGYGVLILELMTGRRPVEYGEDNVVILSDHVRALLEQGNVLDCLDPGMVEYPEEEVLPVLKLALVCTSQIPSSRPTMAEVVQIFQVIKTPLPQRMVSF